MSSVNKEFKSPMHDFIVVHHPTTASDPTQSWQVAQPS